MFHTVRILKERGKLHLLKGIIIPEGGGTDLAAAGLTGRRNLTISILLSSEEDQAMKHMTQALFAGLSVIILSGWNHSVKAQPPCWTRTWT